MSDIVERLRICLEPPGMEWKFVAQLIVEAADAIERKDAEIERLQQQIGDSQTLLDAAMAGLADNERLRKALEPFARWYELNDCDGRDGVLEVPITDLRNSRAALTASAPDATPP